MVEDEEDDFEYRQQRAWPLWVSMGLWGLPGRGWAWGFFWFSLILSLGCTIYGFTDWRFFIGSGFILAALWYFAAIRWVDQNSEWP